MKHLLLRQNKCRGRASTVLKIFKSSCPGYFRKFLKPFGVGTNSNPFNSVKFDGNVSGGGNLNQQDVNAGFSFKLERLKFRFGGQFLQQPAFNFLIFVFGSAEMGRGADNGVSGIVDAVDDVGAFFSNRAAELARAEICLPRASRSGLILNSTHSVSRPSRIRVSR